MIVFEGQEAQFWESAEKIHREVSVLPSVLHLPIGLSLGKVPCMSLINIWSLLITRILACPRVGVMALQRGSGKHFPLFWLILLLGSTWSGILQGCHFNSPLTHHLVLGPPYKFAPLKRQILLFLFHSPESVNIHLGPMNENVC